MSRVATSSGAQVDSHGWHVSSTPARRGVTTRTVISIYVQRTIFRSAQLLAGLWLAGLGAALQVRAGLGLDPWDVFHQGLARRVGHSIGVVVIAVGVVVLLAWIPLRQRPGVGTVANVLLVGTALDVSLGWLPEPTSLLLRVGVLGLGIVMSGAATGMYIGARLGPGPRDGLMTGFAQRSGRSIRLVRTAIELSVLVAGWFLGGTVGVGTVAYALAIGPLAQLFLRVFDRPPLAGQRAPEALSAQPARA